MISPGRNGSNEADRTVIPDAGAGWAFAGGQFCAQSAQLCADYFVVLRIVLSNIYHNGRITNETAEKCSYVFVFYFNQ